VTYRPELRPRVLRQLNGFPADALDALVSVMAAVTMDPDDPLRTHPTPRPRERWAVLGEGAGFVAYTIDEARQLVIVTDVMWVG
jgi:hypothetical protein